MKVADGGGDCESSDFADGVYNAVNAFGSHVLNCSLGWDSFSSTRAYAVLHAAQMNRVFVASKGNWGTDWAHYPSDLTSNWVISVGATTALGELRSSSNYGNMIDVVAPGEDILSTMPTYMTDAMQGEGYPTNYHTLSGTSMAAPHVADLAALMLSRSPDLHQEDVQGIIRSAAEETPYDDVPGYDDRYGAGRIDAAKAIDFLETPWTLNHYTAYGGASVGDVTGGIHFYGPEPLPTDAYYVKRYDVRKTVAMPAQYSGDVYAWGRGLNTTTVGWSSHVRNFQTPCCYVVSCTPTTVELQTFVYDVWSISGRWVGRFPCNPSEVVYDYTVLGIPAVGRNASGEVGLEVMPGEVREIPTHFALCQNRPNPFAEKTQIRFELPEATWVHLAVYDMQGQEVDELVRGEFAAGYHEVVWDAHDHSPGAYLCKLSAGRFSETKPIVVEPGR